MSITNANEKASNHWSISSVFARADTYTLHTNSRISVKNIKYNDDASRTWLIRDFENKVRVKMLNNVNAFTLNFPQIHVCHAQPLNHIFNELLMPQNFLRNTKKTALNGGKQKNWYDLFPSHGNFERRWKSFHFSLFVLHCTTQNWADSVDFSLQKKKRQNLTNILIKWKLLVDFWRMFYACMSFSDGAKFPLPSKQKVSNIHSFGECFETVFNRHIETVHGQQILHAP